MYLNPPDPDFTIEESLLAGSRHTAVNVVDGITRVTTIMVIRLEPAPPIYQVTHVMFREPKPGEREYLTERATHYDDLTAALLAVVELNEGRTP